MDTVLYFFFLSYFCFFCVPALLVGLACLLAWPLLAFQDWRHRLHDQRHPPTPPPALTSQQQCDADFFWGV